MPVEDRPKPTASVDVSHWPVVILTYSGNPAIPQVAEHLREIETRVLARRRPFVQIVDQRAGEPLDPARRALVASHQNRMSFSYAEYCLGEAYVASASMRSTMTAVAWVAKLPYPHVFVDTLEQGIAWGRERVQEWVKRGSSL
jgi:hypothetical protein